MGKKRFVVLESEGSGFSNAMQEIVDTETGAHYLTWQSGHAGGITPLLGADGTDLEALCALADMPPSTATAFRAPVLEVDFSMWVAAMVRR